MNSDKDIRINVDGVSSLYPEIDDSSSIDDTEASAKDTRNLTGRRLTFNHAAFPWRNISVLENDTPIYLADISTFTPGKPDITLHSRTENGPMVGQAHFRWSLFIKAGVGPDDTSMDWTNMKRGGVLRRHYDLEYRGKTYSLRRTHATDHGVAPYQRAIFPHMKVVEEETGEVVAVYNSILTVKRKRGTIHFAKGVSPELEVLCVLGFAAWREKIARAGGRSSGGAGGWS